MALSHAYPLFRRSAASRLGVLSLALSLLVIVASCDKPSGSPAQSNAGGKPQGTYDTPISFGASGTSATIKRSGWSQAEPQFTWTEGKVATLEIPITPTEGQVTLRMTLSGMIKEPEFPTHPVEVLANDQKIAAWEVGNTAPFSAPIPQQLTKAGGKLTLTFNMPKAVSPKDLGKNEDTRTLGICVHNLELSTH